MIRGVFVVTSVDIGGAGRKGVSHLITYGPNRDRPRWACPPESVQMTRRGLSSGSLGSVPLTRVARTVEVSALWDTLVTQPERSRELAQYVRLNTPDCIVQVGDKIVIRKVERVNRGDRFRHLHDAEIRFAYLRVVRASGRPVNIKHPIKFIGNKSIFEVETIDNFCKVILRLVCDYLSIDQISDFDNLLDDSTDANRAASAAFVINDDLDKIQESLKNNSENSGNYPVDIPRGYM
jgi:hypothetical protein